MCYQGCGSDVCGGGYGCVSRCSNSSCTGGCKNGCGSGCSGILFLHEKHLYELIRKLVIFLYKWEKNMNKLSQTETFTEIIKGLPSLKEQLNPKNFPKYTIPISFYENYFNILSVKKYPLVSPVIKAARAGKIRLLNFSDPREFNDKKSILTDAISAVILPLKDTRDYIAFVNAVKKTGYIRNTDKEAIGLKTNEIAMYSYLQTGYLAYLLTIKDREITDNVKLHTLLAEFYGSLIGKVIDQEYPISGEPDAYTRLMFLLALFYLQFMCQYPLDKALKIAMSVKTVDPVIVANKSRAFAAEVLEMKSFNDFIKSFSIEFPFVKKDVVTLRSIVGGVIKTYGSGAMFVVEHFQSFLNLIMSVETRSNIYRDDVISKVIPSQLIKNVAKLLYLISGEI